MNGTKHQRIVSPFEGVPSTLRGFYLNSPAWQVGVIWNPHLMRGSCASLLNPAWSFEEQNVSKEHKPVGALPTACFFENRSTSKSSGFFILEVGLACKEKYFSCIMTD